MALLAAGFVPVVVVDACLAGLDAAAAEVAAGDGSAADDGALATDTGALATDGATLATEGAALAAEEGDSTATAAGFVVAVVGAAALAVVVLAAAAGVSCSGVADALIADLVVLASEMVDDEAFGVQVLAPDAVPTTAVPASMYAHSTSRRNMLTSLSLMGSTSPLILILG